MEAWSFLELLEGDGDWLLGALLGGGRKILASMMEVGGLIVRGMVWALRDP